MLASEVANTDWLPVAQEFPFVAPDTLVANIVDAALEAGIEASAMIVRLTDRQIEAVASRPDLLPSSRRRDVLRAKAMRLSELELFDVSCREGAFGTTTNGTYVPAEIDAYDEDFWRMLGLYLAEGHQSRDGDRVRICWAFHPTAEDDLVTFVAGYWTRLGVKATVRGLETTMQVSISSRILGAWFTATGLGANCDEKAIPDMAWSMAPWHKRALLRGLWDGDGSWSKLSRGPSVTFEFGTVSKRLADGMLRLLGDLGIVARVKVGRSAKSTTDAYFLSISGADQIEQSLWLFPEEEQEAIRRSIAGQSKRIAPTGYRRLSKNAAWVRVVDSHRTPFSGTVYSLEVPNAGTVVTTAGLVVHNCFPKDSRALVRIAEEAGYDFGLLRGVITVNDEQYERVTAKVVQAAGGSVEGVTVGVWGLSFKARTDDRRDSPAIEIIRRLLARGATVRAFDPTVAEGATASDLDGIVVCGDPYAAAEGATVLALLTEWDEFRWLDFDKVRSLLASPTVVDARNLLDPAALRRRGFTYEGVGR